MFTDNEKWITNNKNVRKRSWPKGKQASQSIAKSGLTCSKLMLCVWWDWKGSIHYEILLTGKTGKREKWPESIHNGWDFSPKLRQATPIFSDSPIIVSLVAKCQCIHYKL
ncbi:Mariner Mos1 transposase [Eumeta japonica]|uniref:Mariner Mos1 transposase n=1 Tax=Eumeta variegata TaxID=151549 RepID=A0A4C1W4H8_EUMVA|nr:Mariner Mos1 transposase [Eumeta japonica]